MLPGFAGLLALCKFSVTMFLCLLVYSLPVGPSPTLSHWNFLAIGREDLFSSHFMDIKSDRGSSGPQMERDRVMTPGPTLAELLQ